MYSININTGKIFLTADNTEVLPKTVNYTNYITWLSQDNSPTETDYKPIDDSVSIAHYKKQIEDIFKQLSLRAEASSMNKSNLDIDFLRYQRAEYEDKYNVSIGKITSGSVYDNTLALIQAEMADEFTETKLDSILPTLGVVGFTGTHLEKMFKLIEKKFEIGRVAFDKFNLPARHFRTKSTLWLETGDWNRLDQGIAFAKNIPDSLTLSEAEQLYNDFNLI